MVFLEYLGWLRGVLGFREWSAKMERSLKSQEEGRVHLHAYLSGRGEGELDTTDLSPLVFGGARPRLDANKENRGPTFWLAAKWHGHFYTFCPEKVGSVRWATSVTPWDAYTPEAWWVVRLWKAHKLGHEDYLSLSARLRDGHAKRKADAEAVAATEATLRAKARRTEALQLLAGRRRPFRPLPPPVVAWMGQYRVLDDRYKLLLLHGPSQTGKTALAKHLYGKEWTFVVDVQGATAPDLRKFDAEKHRCVVMDEMSAGAGLILDNKKLMQAHEDGASVAQSPTQRFSYEVMLWRVPIVVTTNYWPPVVGAADKDWLDNNVVAVLVQEPVWVA